tara:strand:- start:1666 stop:1860 length:195 start_codon:yes stop_codon:yes gene_type:complete
MNINKLILILNIIIKNNLSYLRKFCLVPSLPFDDDKCNKSEKNNELSIYFSLKLKENKESIFQY